MSQFIRDALRDVHDLTYVMQARYNKPTVENCGVLTIES